MSRLAMICYNFLLVKNASLVHHVKVYPLTFLYQVYFLTRVVPQMLAMMVDLEEDPEWSTTDDLDDDDCDR